MAKLKGPLFSNRASGSIGPCLTFSQRRSGQQARRQRKQKDKITDDRTIERNFYTEAVAHWNQLIDFEKEQWDIFNNS